jgi:hypothetical protein
MQKMPARSKLIIKHRRRDKDMDSKIIEIEEIRMKRLEDKTKAWGQGPQDDDRTRCWGPCPPVLEEEKKDELEVLEIT